MLAKSIGQTGASPQPAEGQGLIRGMGLGSATALNMIDMIGVGPFITIPLIVTAMGGPQAMLGWVLGAVLAACDGLVWAELGAAMPGSGGSYRYLKEIYGPQKLGRLISFLFIWQISFSAPLSIASGCGSSTGVILYGMPGPFPIRRPCWRGLKRVAFTFVFGLSLISRNDRRSSPRGWRRAFW